MAKGKNTIYFCQNCGYESAKWMGQCPACHEWNTFAEEPAPAKAGSSGTDNAVRFSRAAIVSSMEKAGASGAAGSRNMSSRSRVQRLRDVEISSTNRTSTGIGEMDRVLGGGIVAGSLILVGGDPGIGKSTLLLQVCRNLAAGHFEAPAEDQTEDDGSAADQGQSTAAATATRPRFGKVFPGTEGISGAQWQPQQAAQAHLQQELRRDSQQQRQQAVQTQAQQEARADRQQQSQQDLNTTGLRVLYVSGEESQQQIKMRADRMGEFGDSMLIFCETNLSDIQEAIARVQPQVVVIDSIQTMYNENVASAPGSVSQVRETTAVLLQIAKGLGITVFIVGHVTKEGMVAGPRVLEHMVDTVLYFEGDRHASYRILHAVKNRFGSTDEIGVFEMKSNGLREVQNPSEFMLDGRPQGASGSVVACSMEGSRPILIEVQALTASTSLAYPRRTADGADVNRVNLLLAVLEKRLGLDLGRCDVYVNITGGLRLREPAVDLGIAAAVISSYKDIPIDESCMVFGEIGLSGEIRSVSQAPLRVREAAKLGFTTIVLPAVNLRSVGRVEGVRLIGVRTLRDLIAFFQDSGGGRGNIGSARDSDFGQGEEPIYY